MLFETPRYRVVNEYGLQFAEYMFVLCMTAEMFFKLCSNGLFFTPQAMVRYNTGQNLLSQFSKQFIEYELICILQLVIIA